VADLRTELPPASRAALDEVLAGLPPPLGTATDAR